jgi:hypothetical protein
MADRFFGAARLATRLLVLCVLLLLCAMPAAAADKTTTGELVTEPPTLVSLGFEWLISGDDNRNATVAVSYRRRGEQMWRQGLSLLRIGNERINENALQYVTPNGFAGSVFDLEPATEYEARFVLSDPDGVEGKAERIVTVRTRPEPVPAAGGHVYHVYPPGFNGMKQEPAFTGLLAAYYTGSSHSDNFNTFSPATRFSCTRESTKTIGSGTAVDSAPSRAERTS